MSHVCKVFYPTTIFNIKITAADRTVLLWDIKDLSQKGQKSLRRINIDFDYATLVKWSPDTRAFIISKYTFNTLEVYKIEKKQGCLGPISKSFTFPKEHAEDIIGMGIASNGKFIMSCSNKTDMIIWSLKGDILARIDTCLMKTYCAKISPCAKFIAASGFSPDVKVWEVLFTKSGDFQEVKTVFPLSGHTSGIYDVAFNENSTHLATVSNDGTWKLFDIAVEYKNGEDPHLLMSGKYVKKSTPSLIALSPNAEVVVIGSGSCLNFYSTLTGKLDRVIDNASNMSASNNPNHITAILFDSAGKLVFASTDRFIRVFHNVTGYKCEIESAQKKLAQSSITSAMKDRLEALIKSNEAFLDEIEEKK